MGSKGEYVSVGKDWQALLCSISKKACETCNRLPAGMEGKRFTQSLIATPILTTSPSREKKEERRKKSELLGVRVPWYLNSKAYPATSSRHMKRVPALILRDRASAAPRCRATSRAASGGTGFRATRFF